MGDQSGQDGSFKFAFGIHGTRGDFQPYLILAKHLVERGHKVKFFTQINHCETAKLFGVDAVCTAGDMEKGLQEEASKKAMEAGDMAMMVLGCKPEEEEELVNGKTIEQLKNEAHDEFMNFWPHVYLTNVLGHITNFDWMLQTFEIINLSVGLQPQAGPPSNSIKNIGWAREFPEPDIPLIATHIWPDQAEARRTHGTLQGLAMSGQINEEILDKIPGPETIFRNKYEAEKKTEWQVLAYSPSVFPPPDDWPDVTQPDCKIQVVGRLQFTSEQQEEASKGGNEFFSSSEAHADLKTFLDKGNPPVYIGWGSMSVYTSAHMTFLAVEALKRAGQRGIIVSGWAGLSAKDLDDDRPGAEECRAFVAENVLFAKTAPHEWLFPRCCCCVHHGGAGTTQASLGAGTPTIITPVFADQESNAVEVDKRGWGKATTKLGKLKSKELGDAIGKVCGDPGFKKRTMELKAKMDKEDGVTTAANLLERLVKDYLFTGRYKEERSAEKAELRKIKEKQLAMPTETIVANWNMKLNKRYPAYGEYNKSLMVFVASCSPALEEGRLWYVTASSCLAREGEKLKSAEAGRFRRYCFLEQIEEKGSRMRVKKLRGFGPEEGWISPTASGQELLAKITERSQIGAVQAEMFNKLFADIIEAVGDTPYTP